MTDRPLHATRTATRAAEKRPLVRSTRRSSHEQNHLLLSPERGGREKEERRLGFWLCLLQEPCLCLYRQTLWKTLMGLLGLQLFTYSAQTLFVGPPIACDPSRLMVFSV